MKKKYKTLGMESKIQVKKKSVKVLKYKSLPVDKGQSTQLWVDK